MWATLSWTVQPGQSVGRSHCASVRSAHVVMMSPHTSSNNAINGSVMPATLPVSCVAGPRRGIVLPWVFDGLSRATLPTGPRLSRATRKWRRSRSGHWDRRRRCCGGATIPRTSPMTGRRPGISASFPPPGGCFLAVMEIAPTGDDFHEFVRDALVPWSDPDEAGMHRSATIDYDIVLEGTIGLELDDGVEVTLHPGDVVVQNGTRHRWHNRGDLGRADGVGDGGRFQLVGGWCAAALTRFARARVVQRWLTKSALVGALVGRVAARFVCGAAAPKIFRKS